MSSADHGGHWGEITSTINWCEHDYHVTPFIAEFYNTISNIFFFGLGLFGAYKAWRLGHERCIVVQFLFVAVVGLGSALFHATLRHAQQQADETPMVWSILAWSYLLWEADIRRVSPALASMLVPLMVVYGVVFAALHWHYRWVIGFQLHFAAFVFGDLFRFLRHWREHPDPQASILAAGYVHLGFVGFSLWMMDQQMCETMHNLPINPQGHAWWHVFMGINAYCGPAFMQYVRAKKNGWKPTIRYCFGVLPYVHTEKHTLLDSRVRQ